MPLLHRIFNRSFLGLMLPVTALGLVFHTPVVLFVVPSFMPAPVLLPEVGTTTLSVSACKHSPAVHLENII